MSKLSVKYASREMERLQVKKETGAAIAAVLAISQAVLVLAAHATDTALVASDTALIASDTAFIASKNNKISNGDGEDKVRAETVHNSAHTTENLLFEKLSPSSGIVGLNYVIGKNGYPLISDLYKGGPAEKAGLKIGDEIVKVGNRDARYIGYLHLQPLLTGEKGSTLSLTVRREGIENASAAGSHTVTLKRASVASFNDPDLRKYEVAKWRASESNLAQLEHFNNRLVDLPFALLSREHNRPTLFEFVELPGDPGIADQLRKHPDGNYVLSQCRIVRITADDTENGPIRKYLAQASGAGVEAGYALIPVYQPWLVTVRAGDILTSAPSEQQVCLIAKNLVHNSIKVQVSHAVAKQKGYPEAGEKLNKRLGLAHVSVIKRICTPLPADHGIVGLGFAAGNNGYAAVTQVFGGGPAEKAGLKAGDEIIEIDGQDTRYLGLEHIQEALSGPIGQSVTLSIARSGAAVTVPSARSGTAVTLPNARSGTAVTLPNARSGTAVTLPNARPGAAVTKTLKFVTPKSFKESELTQLTIAHWQQIMSSTTDDSNEYELPCCMVSAAGDRPTIFEFRQSTNGEGAREVLEKVKLQDQNKFKQIGNRTQVITYTSAAPDFEKLRKYFHITQPYACLPIYFRGRHKTVKAAEITFELPSADALKLAIEAVSSAADQN